MKSIVLCADDFAYNSAISQSILSLIQERRISATSCMTNMPHWPDAAKQLKAFNGKIDIGLHFNLTEGTALSQHGQTLFMPLNKLLAQSIFKKVNSQQIYDEFCAQMDVFLRYCGRLPDFIDGHQHIHQFPVIRSAVLKAYQHYFPNSTAYIRVSSNSLIKSVSQARHCPKSLIITATGALTLKRQLQKLGIPHNDSFSGTYSLRPQQNYAALFAKFINGVDEHGIIMCHPANHSDSKTDRIATARQQEFDFFSSGAFSSILERIHLARF